MDLFISVIVPVYNVESYVAACLKSVKDQAEEGLHIECIVVDDCGKDNSMGIVRSILDDYNGSIDFKILTHERNKGLSEARNTGIRTAKGDYVFFLDSDDCLLKHALINLATLAKKYPDAEIVQGEIQLSTPREGMNSYLGLSAVVLPEYISGHEKARHALLFDTPVTAWAKLIKRDFIIHNKLYFEPGMVHEDDMWRVSASSFIKNIAYFFTPIYLYNRDINGSIINTSDKTRSMSGKLKVIENAVCQFEKEPCRDYINYLDRELDMKERIDRWPYIRDKKLIKKQMASVRKVFESSSLPSGIKRKYAFFSSNEKVFFNRYFKFLACLIIQRRVIKQVDRFKN